MEHSNSDSEFNKLVEQLRIIFRMDRSDLDFGLYRIMNLKNEEIDDFLANKLLPQVRSILGEANLFERESLASQLEEAKASAEALGVDPSETPRVKELQEKLDSGIDIVASEAAVYSHLHNFFSRYYVDGDFQTVRRYKKDVYTIPYEGEEIKLHWANFDQYYVKALEKLNYFKIQLPENKSVIFKVVEATTNMNNNKSTLEDKCYYHLDAETPLEHHENQLTIRFKYGESEQKRTTQPKINESTVLKLLEHSEIESFGLKAPNPTKANGTRTLIEKYVNEFTSRRDGDYFIHKDLKNFLVRELDFFIKNELLIIDDLDELIFNTGKGIFQIASAVKSIGMKIVSFLVQLEEFQKKLWLKKKFVLSMNYCISLEIIIESPNSEAILEMIASNEKQRKEWKKLFSIDKQQSNLVDSGCSDPLTVEFLKSNQNLPVDTKFFTVEEKFKILNCVEDIDNRTNGILIESENFQALNLLTERFSNSIKFTYIDPPFNLGENADYLYKVDYKDSTWLTMLENRIRKSKDLMSSDGSIMVRCSHDGNMLVRLLMESIFDKRNFRNEIIVRRAEVSKGDLNKQFNGVRSITVNYDNLYWFSKTSESRFDRFMKKTTATQAKAHWHSFWKAEDRKNLRYPIMGIDLSEHYGQWMWKQERAEQAVENYESYLKVREKTGISLEDYWAEKQEEFKESMGRNLEFVYRFGDGYSSIKYWIPPREEVMADNNWLDIKGYANIWGFKTENSEGLLKRTIETLTKEGEFVMDYFAGSGTAAAAAHKMGRKWIAVEMGGQCESIVKHRMLNVLYGDKSGISKEVNWSGGGCFKYMELEQFEDSLDNIRINRIQEPGLFENENFNEEYLLGYMLDFETRGSKSLISAKDFDSPFDCTMELRRKGHVKISAVDLVETFNWLLGITVSQVCNDSAGIVEVTGTCKNGEACLIIWRDICQVDNNSLNEWFKVKKLENAKSLDVIYVNGDCNLETLKSNGHNWSVRLTESAFKKLMFSAA